ncbi:MAG: hypothetical protein ABIE14_01075, partial [Patescibacteria group bacterium]
KQEFLNCKKESRDGDLKKRIRNLLILGVKLFSQTKNLLIRFDCMCVKLQFNLLLLKPFSAKITQFATEKARIKK